MQAKETDGAAAFPVHGVGNAAHDRVCGGRHHNRWSDL